MLKRFAHFQEAANRLEGKVESSDESAGNVVFNITISAPRPHRPAIEVAPTTPRDSGSRAEKFKTACSRGRHPLDMRPRNTLFVSETQQITASCRIRHRG